MGAQTMGRKKLIKMSEEVKTDAAVAEAPAAEDLKAQKRSLEAECLDGEIKKAKTANGSSNGADEAENGAAEEDGEEGDEEEGDEEEDLDGEEEGEEDLDEEAEGEEGEEEEDGEGEEEED